MTSNLTASSPGNSYRSRRTYSLAKIPSNSMHDIDTSYSKYKGKSDYISYSRKKRDKSHKFDTLLKWKKTPTKCLIVKKINDIQCTIDLLSVSSFLLNNHPALNIFFESATYSEISSWSKDTSNKNKHKDLALKVISASRICKIQDDLNVGKGIQFIIVLGGDGTLLYLVSLFRNHQHVPPIMCFQRGSLGFLAPFQFSDYENILNGLLDIKTRSSICIRMRLTARIWRHPNNYDDDDDDKNDNHNNIKPVPVVPVATPTPTTTTPKVQINDNKDKSTGNKPHIGHHRKWSDEVEKVENIKKLLNSPSPVSSPPVATSTLAKNKNKNKNLNKNQNKDQLILLKTKSTGDILHSTINENQQFCDNNISVPDKTDDVVSPAVSAPIGFKDNYSIQHDTDILFTKTQNIFPDHICNDIICHALNEVLIHRDNNASMMQANLFIDGDECTVIQADGMIFSTATGSTAYNISAGGSLISPTVPCIALTPICPHTLSFRPVVVSDETIIHIQIPKTARYKAVISFDGRNHITLDKGDVVEILKCPYPVPTFKSSRFNVEWFHGLVDKFNWNKRDVQKPFKPNDNNNNNDDQKQQIK